MFGADENIRPGKDDPRQGAETCTMVEFMASFESLLKITGETVWADRGEEIAFNSLPASMTPDLKGLHYLTAPNLISCDSSGEHDFQNAGTLVSYDPWSYRCCQHNVAFGWPYFAEHLWMATADNGLAATLYAPSEVTAKVAEGADVSVSEETSYPFEDQVRLSLSCDRPVAFPLYLRLPGWAKAVRIVLNGEPVEGIFPGGRYAVLRRTWHHGDQVRLEFDPQIEIVRGRPSGAPSRCAAAPSGTPSRSGRGGRGTAGRRPGRPARSCRRRPGTTAWSSAARGAPGREAGLCAAPPYQPFTPEGAPIVLKVRARRVPGWKEEGRMVGPVPASPAEGEGPAEEVDLIPMGCARLRISVFPVVKD